MFVRVAGMFPRGVLAPQHVIATVIKSKAAKITESTGQLNAWLRQKNQIRWSHT